MHVLMLLLNQSLAFHIVEEVGMSSQVCKAAWICCLTGMHLTLGKGTDQCVLVQFLAWPLCIPDIDCKLTGCYMQKLLIA